VSEDVEPGRLREIGQLRGTAQRAGVLLHGRGRAPEEKVDLAMRMGHVGDMRWLVPSADSGSWYPNRFMDPISANEPFLSEAVEQCSKAVTEASEDGQLETDRIAIVGFSQGACLALEYVLRHPGQCGTLIAFSGALMGLPGRNWKASTKPMAGLRVLITGSDIDEWIPELCTRESGRILNDLGASVVTRIYKGRPHVVGDEEIAEAAMFLKY
jgi:phospholipase/carboxylesterase